jgi:anthranilate phosphoribosyltransferase
MFKEIISSLSNQKKLTDQQITFFLEQIEEGKLNIAQQAAILSGIKFRGHDSKELAAFAKFLHSRMSDAGSFPEAIDLCGTGGSGLNRINTSTLVAFIVSALGVPVAKHGNKSASGRYGSFDLLEDLGINIDLNSSELQRISRQLGLAFLYARKFHPAMRHLAPVREQLKFPTILNLLGPLLNPAQVRRQMIGVPRREFMMLMAEAGKRLGKKELMLVCGEDGLDEVTLAGKTFVVELNHGKIRTSTLKPASFGISSCSPEAISGGDAKMNQQFALSILQGTCTSRHLDLVLVNAALALKIAGKTSNLKKAYQLAKECVLSGKAYHQFLAYRQASKTPAILLDIVAQKRKEVELRKKKTGLKQLMKKVKPSQRNFRSALLDREVALIAEIKKSSPSTGKIASSRFDVTKIAKTYEDAGTAAISVLTDEKFFGGALENLTKARIATHHTPLLCKDFIIDPYQIYEARAYGADAVLLIAAILTKTELQTFVNIARQLNMAALCEIHNEEELKLTLETDADIIGINNRDLHSFKIDLKTTERLCRKIPAEKIIVAESGFSGRPQLRKIPSKADAVLIGTVLMKSKDPAKKIQELFGRRKPLLKTCGVRNIEQAKYAQKLGVDMIGLNFVPTSERRISYQMGEQIIKALRQQPKNATKIVGVFQNQNLSEVQAAATRLRLDYIQLSGNESVADVKKLSIPVIKGISVRKKSDLRKTKKYYPFVRYLLLDGKKPGAGETFPHRFLKDFDLPYLLAGGINPSNARECIKTLQPLGIDVASGIETEGEVDLRKIKRLVMVRDSSTSVGMTK